MALMNLVFGRRGGCLPLCALLLSACATPGAGPVWPYPEPPNSEGVYAPRQPGADRDWIRDEPAAAQLPAASGRATSSHPTVQALVEQAEQEQANGELDRAAATLERAIRIVNNDPLPWLRLAQLRFEQGNLIQAENLARRSLSFADYGASAKESWLLIADIKRLQGDAVAASAAEERAQRL